jgi:hypothetical protein
MRCWFQAEARPVLRETGPLPGDSAIRSAIRDTHFPIDVETSSPKIVANVGLVKCLSHRSGTIEVANVGLVKCLSHRSEVKCPIEAK